MKLLVFSDDWGRHPSSCQHLIRHLLLDYDVTWVNTIGMRPPRLDRITWQRGMEKLRSWTQKKSFAESVNRHVYDLSSTRASGVAPRVVNAKMWPWMTHSWDRRINRKLLTSQLKQHARDAAVVTTIPIVADLIGNLSSNKWVYYCVDDFSVWPGLDGKILGQMEDELIDKVDTIVAASEVLADGIRRRGRQASVLSHGVDVDFWSCVKQNVNSTQISESILFWGVVDRRMNSEWVLALGDSLTDNTISLVGPQQDPDPRLRTHPRIRMLGPMSFEQLPTLAQHAAVLIMPYADLPVTRAMQPLKLKEYLATGKPVVVSRLPATKGWEQYLQIANNQEEFVALVHKALQRDKDAASSHDLKQLLFQESWKSKSVSFVELLG